MKAVRFVPLRPKAWQKVIRLFFATAIALILVRNALPLIRQISFFGLYQVATPEKVVALTYDDGPAPPYTEAILEILNDYQAKATFYVVGQNIELYPDTIRQTIAAGHELSNHSYEHKYMAFRSWDYITNEVDKTDQLLRNLGVTGQIDFRPPWGRRFLLLPLYLHQQQKRLVIWDVDSFDWEIEASPTDIAARVIGAVQPGSIVLMHDGGGDRQRTVEATDLILSQLTEAGYRFVTVAELFELS
ncbi:polysaccharide deacetylase family protein [Synechococcus sp. BDU 130192]|uniref:polysaccharide deacetylase family protein n=1 Tax=Synechococcus sp. BDU 130192 TaxID=2042059 RepID=UPI000C0689E3|nr:polysaccharide deacetylase family protein [Synechococcus sp. BDU 130192]